MYFRKRLLNNQFILLQFLDYALFGYKALVASKHDIKAHFRHQQLLKGLLFEFRFHHNKKNANLRNEFEANLHLNKFLQIKPLTKMGKQF